MKMFLSLTSAKKIPIFGCKSSSPRPRMQRFLFLDPLCKHSHLSPCVNIGSNINMFDSEDFNLGPSVHAEVPLLYLALGRDIPVLDFWCK